MSSRTAAPCDSDADAPLRASADRDQKLLVFAAVTRSLAGATSNHDLSLGVAGPTVFSVDLSASLAGLAGHKLFPSTTTGRTVFLHGSIPLFAVTHPKPAPRAKDLQASDRPIPTAVCDANEGALRRIRSTSQNRSSNHRQDLIGRESGQRDATLCIQVKLCFRSIIQVACAIT